MPRALLVAVLLLIPGALEAQVASYSYLAQGKGHSVPNAPWLEALNLPRIGTTFMVRVPGSHVPVIGVRDFYVLASGATNPAIQLDGWRGRLLCSADVVLPTPMTLYPGVKVVMSFPIPNSTTLLGLRFYQQVATSPWTCTPGSTCAFSIGGVGLVGR